jgi:hypothetical protein
MKPARIQRKRTKGWKIPDDTVIVTRPTKWGNPFIVSPKARPGARSGAGFICVPTAKEAVLTYREYLNQRPEIVEAARTELRGKNLACFCPIDQPCHADVLLELANA